MTVRNAESAFQALKFRDQAPQFQALTGQQAFARRGAGAQRPDQQKDPFSIVWWCTLIWYTIVWYNVVWYKIMSAEGFYGLVRRGFQNRGFVGS